MGCTTSTSKVGPLPDQQGEEFHDRFILGKKLGRGAFAQVRVATRVKDAESELKEEAVKILDLRDENILSNGSIDTKLVASAQTEAKVWRRAAKNNSHVVQLHEVFHDSICCYFVMEKCSRGLFQYLEALPELNERSLGNIIRQMLLSLSELHTVGVVHRDVKPDNFLVGGDDGHTIKLGDFGLSAILPVDGKLKGCSGTAPFMCPEMLKGKSYDEKADVWSMAVLAYVLLFGDFPYVPQERSSKAMKKAVLEGKPPSFEPNASCKGPRSSSAIACVETLLQRQPEKRLAASDALHLPYLVAVSKNQHVPKVDLPSLRPAFISAKKHGAFEIRDLVKMSNVDDLLNGKQMEKQGMSMPQAQPCQKDSLFAKVRDVRPSNTLQKPPSPPINGSGNSRIWSNSSSLVTWNDSCSLATTASGTDTSMQASLLSSAWSPANSGQHWNPVNSVPTWSPVNSLVN